MKKALLNITNFLFFLFCTIAVVDAQTAPTVVKKAFNVRQGGQLTLNSELGMIDVKATNRNRVDVVFTKSLKSGGNIIIGGLTRFELDRLVQEMLADFEPTFKPEGSNVFITAKFKQGLEYWLRKFPQVHTVFAMKAKIEFQVTVPRRYNVDLTTGSSGDISVGNIGGAVITKTDYGDIQLGSVAGSVNAKTGSNGGITIKGCQSEVEAITDYGDIQLNNVTGSVSAKTGSNGGITIKGCQSEVKAITDYGDIQLNNVAGSVNAKTGSNGGITIKGCQSEVKAITDYGDIQLNNVTGSVNAKTGSNGEIHGDNIRGSVIAKTDYGDIQLNNVAGSVNAQTGSSGSITIKGCQSEVEAKTDYGDIQLNDVTGSVNAQTGSSGEIIVALIPSIAIDVDALSKSGSVSSDFPVRGEKSKNSLKGTINGGGPLLRLHTSYGDIRLLRKGR